MLLSIVVALAAQFFSGAAAIINQTVWQRSLLVYLAGSAAVSSMIVVLVFMAGLGAGALWVGRSADRIENPARAVVLVELLLAGANLLVLGLLSLDVSETLRALQRSTAALGVPLPLLYAVVASLVLLGPCFLMGVTSPLMSEVAQRQLGLRHNRFLVTLFFVNTLGAFAGGFATGFQLLPRIGQRGSLVIAIALNVTAAFLLLGLARLPSKTTAERKRPAAVEPPRRSRRLAALAFGLGCLSLAYEMYLYRVVALAFEPKPFTFATVLCLFLLVWSVGVLLAQWIPWRLAFTLALTAAATLMATPLANRPWPSELDWTQMALAAGFWLPCLGFGAAFGQLVMAAAVNWGNDVGHVYGWNTIGSCSGILIGVLIGYEFHPAYMVLAISLGYLALAAFSLVQEGEARRRGRSLAFAVVSSLALGVWVSELADLIITTRVARASGSRSYFGREGVVEIVSNEAMFWNGLGHAPLSRNRNHVGQNNWLQAVVPLLGHRSGRDLDALVVGLGAGATVATIAQSSAVRSVEVYELNPELERFLADYPDGTLHVGTSPKVKLRWEDGRTGLTVSPKRYDLITQAPLYLKQAGSSVLLSREYMQLVRSRLKPGGVYAVYCNALGHGGQALVVRQTAAGVFRYGESFNNGYLLLVSDSPIAFDVDSIERALAAADVGDPFVAEAREFGVGRLAATLDRPRLPWEGSPVIVTDNHPIVEYPEIADEIVAGGVR
jgi:spermidine synthase